MRTLQRFVATSLLLLSTHLHAESNESMDTETLTEYLKNLGTYLGFDLATAPAAGDPLVTLLDVSATTLAQQYSFITLLGAVPVNTYTDALAYFVPSNNTNYSLINDMANYTFQTQPNGGNYQTPSTGESSSVSVSELIDQKDYQKDPVTQSILNTLATPQTTYCLDVANKKIVSDCTYLYNSKVMTNVVGTVPSTYDFFSYDYLKTILPQLSINTLLGPLLYTTEGTSEANQAQTAQNYIRYATGAVKPIDLPKKEEYDSLYQTAISTDESDAGKYDRLLAQERIAKYLVSLYIYSARSSISTSNLYYLLAKRMPQNQSDSDSSQQTSQALSEFQMATRRLYDPSKKDSENTKQWVDQINEASNTTVQKEIAILLSEINYQLYLSREVNERILATLSVLGAGAVQAPAFAGDAVIETSSETSDLGT